MYRRATGDGRERSADTSSQVNAAKILSVNESDFLVLFIHGCTRPQERQAQLLK